MLSRSPRFVDPSRGISLLIVDDHRLFAELLARRLDGEERFGDVAIAHGLAEAKAVAPRCAPDVVLLDHDLDGDPGTRLLEDLRALPRPPAVLMLSATEDPPAIVGALAAGASGWVLKNSPVDTVLTATEHVLEGHMYLDPCTVRPVVESLLAARPRLREPDFVDRLSVRQTEVLRCLVSGMTRAEVAARLFITPNTVRTHVQALMQPAGEHSTLALVARARELGVTGIDDAMDRGAPSSG